MAYNTLTLEYDAALAGNLATITLSRPEKRNAISSEMIEELLSALGALELGPSRVVMITGAGRAFCSGMDLEELKTLAAQSAEGNLAGARRTSRLFRYLWSYPKPIIAAVNGPALAGGCGIATLCDFTLASEESKFGYTEVRVGFIPALVALYLERQVGEKIARDLLLTGRILEAGEAFRLGLVTRVIPAAELLSSARELATTLIANSPGAICATKRLFVRPDEDEVDRRIALALAESVAIRSTSDFHEGIAAFLEKRKPHWTGR